MGGVKFFMIGERIENSYDSSIFLFPISSIAGFGKDAEEVLTVGLDETSMLVIHDKICDVLKKAGLFSKKWNEFEPDIDVELGVGVGTETSFTFVHLQLKEPDKPLQVITLEGVSGIDDLNDRRYHHLNLHCALSGENAKCLANSISSGDWEKECGIRFDGLDDENSRISKFLSNYGTVKTKELPIEVQLPEAGRGQENSGKYK